jgi:1-acyl-sn-glycerol-3-phosphate acyltransferase
LPACAKPLREGRILTFDIVWFDVKRSSFIYCVTREIARWVLSIFYRIEIKPQSAFLDHGPVIILPKHQYWTDIPLVGLTFKSLLYFIAKKELFKYPILRGYLSLGGAIPVDRHRSIRSLESFKILHSLLRAGEKIVIFPEGTYVRDLVGSGKSRLIEMILRFQSELKDPIPFIPVGIRYGERVGWRRQVEICVGRPLFGEGASDAIPLTNQVMKEISCLCQLPQCTDRIAQSA